MKVRIPLYLQMLAWFFLNLLLLACGFYLFFTFQFRVGLDSLLAGHAGERVQATANLIGSQLHDAAPDQWNSVLKRDGDAYRLEFYLFRPDGIQVAGNTITLPENVRARTLGRGGPPGPRQGPPPNSQPPEPPDSPDAMLFPEPPQTGGQRPEPGSLRTDRFRPPRGGNFPPAFMVRSANPTRYWVGVHVPPPHQEAWGPRPLVLLAVSDSLSGSGMFFDTGPWVMVGVAAVLLSVLFWFPLARGFTKSISQITHATEEIAAGRFGARVNARRPDELGRLAEAINQMSFRLSGFVTGQKRFLGDIAHELCSPISRIQLLLGIIEQQKSQSAPTDSAKGEQTHFDDLREEVQQMSGLVNELLSFSKASLRPGAIKLQPVLVRPIVEQAARREGGGADAIRCDIPPGICVLADPDLLLRSLANLLRNAFRYAGTAGPITVSAQADGAVVVIRVSDCGPGVPAESLPFLLDPFYRPESSRARETGGAGLGLAIVKTCVESCQGTVTCRNRQPKGFEVELRIKET